MQRRDRESPRPIQFPRQLETFPQVKVVGQAFTAHHDLYHFILSRTWLGFFSLTGAIYVLINTFFALLYWMRPGSIANASGSFVDAFFFSVQTMATIGYGVMSPATLYAHILVTIEAIVSMLATALVTGITFAKFARPTARVLFCENPVVSYRNGVPFLMFRMANWRHNQIIEAQLKVILLVTERTREGDSLRRPIELPLVRDKTPLFWMSWSAMHEITPTSPLYGVGAMDRLREQNAEMFLTLTGLDETFAAPVHARKSYKLTDIVWGARFKDILKTLEDGTRVINYHDFHLYHLQANEHAENLKRWVEADAVQANSETSS